MAQNLTSAMEHGHSLALRAGLAQWWLKLRKDLFDPYRPERHYMRGPGPKWRAKHPLALAGRQSRG